jgi:uncharacterized protein (TIGR03435 family)
MNANPVRFGFSFGILMLAAGWAQAPAPAEFEVASVKLTQHGRTVEGSSHSTVGNTDQGSFSATNATLQMLLVWAYDVKDYQISGPDWLNSEDARYDITAKSPAGVPSRQMPAMLQSLLVERFKLALHRETRTLPIYELVIAKSGPKIHEVASDGHSNSTRMGEGRLTATHVTMTDLAVQLSRHLGRAVIDQTGLKGAFDFTLDYAADDADTSRPSIFTALQEQLGLRLEATKGPVEVLVVDRAERIPTEN